MTICPSCGKENPEGFDFCGFCGDALDQTPVTQSIERKVVSVLFVDLVGFTAQSHAADPEDVKAALTPYHQAATEEIERFGGTIEKFIGDAVMAVFGAPVAHEDDAERAVRAALSVAEAIAELNRQDPSLNLSFRAAVNTGETLFSLTARPELGDDFIAGDVINVASRLQNLAPVNGIVVGETTYRLTKDVIEFEHLEPVIVKGKPDPLPVWRVLSAHSRVGADSEVAPRTPFIGREHELKILKETFRRTLHESSVQMVTIVGEPGVGKTRLLREFSSFVDEQEELIVWRQGRSLPYGEGITFWALGEILKADAGILESDSSERAGNKLRAAVGTLIKESSEHQWFLSRLSPLVGVEVSEDASRSREESFTAWRRFLEAIAEQRPLVLVFEDLHWADPSLLEFIEHLVDWVSGVPIFVVCTARPELYDKNPGWGGGKRNITVVSLSPLNDTETAKLISSLLSQAVLPAEVRTTLLERAGGNPLYAEEFIRMLSDREILRQKEGVLSLETDAQIPLPESLHALIAARLDTLPMERKLLLQDASVAGKIFWFGAVAAIGQSDHESIRHGLHELRSKELVRSSRTSSMQGEQEFSFWHALIRDVSYSQIPRAVRANKHKAMAAWIEGTAERLEEYAEVLAHHYSTALDFAKASGEDDVAELEGQTRRFVVAAADRALILDPVKALALYRQALDLLDPDDPEVFRVLREAGTACTLVGLFSESQEYLEQAIAGFRARQDLKGEALALRRLEVLFRNDGRNEDARSLAVRAVELLEQQTPGKELAFAYAQLAFFEVSADSLDSGLAYVKKALDVALSCGGGADEAVAGALFVRGWARFESGDLGWIDDLREAIRISETTGDAEVASYSYTWLPFMIALTGGPLEGLKATKRALDYTRSHGFMSDAVGAQTDALFMLFDLGRWDALLEQADELLKWAQERGSTRTEAFVTLGAALPLLHRGEMPEALSVGGRLLPIVRDMNEIDLLSMALSSAAVMSARAGEDPSALVKEFEQRTKDAPFYRARFLPDVVRALIAAGSIEWARRLLVEEKNVVFKSDRNAVISARAIVTEADGESGRALELYKDAARRWKQFGVVLEEGEALLGMGRCLMTLGRTADAFPVFQEARTIFASLGAVPLGKETDACLERLTSLTGSQFN